MNKIEHLTKRIDDIDKVFKNTFLNHIQVLTNFDFLLCFSKSSLGSILISINPYNPFIKQVKEKFLINNKNYFISKIKNKIENAKLTNIEVLNNDNIVAFHFNKTNETYDKFHYILIIELFKNNSNLILVESNKIIDALHLRSLETKRPIMINMTYHLPNEVSSVKEFDQKLLDFEDDYINNIEKSCLDEKYGYVKKTLKAKIKSLATKIDKVTKDREDAQKKFIYKDLADYLLTNFEEEKNKLEIKFNGEIYKLDPRLSFEKNIQRLYKNYKKAKSTIEISNKYINESKDLKEYLETILNTLSFLNEEDYLELIDELEKNNILKTNHKIKKKEISKVKPYYIVVDNTKIGYGKNNIQNDYLTFKEAKKDYYFLHINKSHGPHVCILSLNPTLKEKEIASEIAIYLSNNTVGEVMYTKIKNVKKADMPGKVNILSYETFNINKFKYDIPLLLKDSKRF